MRVFAWHLSNICWKHRKFSRVEITFDWTFPFVSFKGFSEKTRLPIISFWDRKVSRSIPNQWSKWDNSSWVCWYPLKNLFTRKTWLLMFSLLDLNILMRMNRGRSLLFSRKAEECIWKWVIIEAIHSYTQSMKIFSSNTETNLTDCSMNLFSSLKWV